MALIDKDKAVDAIAMYLFINDAIRSTEPMKVADYRTFAESILKDVPEVDAIPRDYYEKVVEELCRKHTEEIASMPTIVRCKECDMSEVYQNDSSGVMARYCRAFAPNRMVADDDFCSYGERKDNE